MKNWKKSRPQNPRFVDRIPTGNLYVISYEAEDGHAIAYAILTVSLGLTGSEAILWHIQTNEKYRRMGYGKILLHHLQTKLDKIITQINDNAGDALCVASGFRKIGTLIIWERSKDGFKRVNVPSNTGRPDDASPEPAASANDGAEPNARAA